MAPFCRGGKPFHRIGIALGQALALRISEGKPELTLCVALLGGEAMLDGLDEILRDASSILVHGAEIALGLGKTLLGGKSIIFGSLDVVLRHAKAVFVECPKEHLAEHIALLGCESEPLCRFAIGLITAAAARISPAKLGLCRRIPRR